LELAMKKLYAVLAGLMVLIFAFAPMAAAAPPMTVYVTTTGTGVGYPTWADATNSIQTAIDIISNSTASTVWVSNGVYDTGGVTNYPSSTSILTNRVAIYKNITVRSANNDPVHTIIMGAKDAGTGSNGPAAVRCVYMANNSTLIGFTLTNGATLTNTSAGTYDMVGGGIVTKASLSPVISNCVIAGNSAVTEGGGVYYGTLYNCTLIGNAVVSSVVFHADVDLFKMFLARSTFARI
jgi:hypothetical protein